MWGRGLLCVFISRRVRRFRRKSAEISARSNLIFALYLINILLRVINLYSEGISADFLRNLAHSAGNNHILTKLTEFPSDLQIKSQLLPLFPLKYHFPSADRGILP